MSEKQTHIAPQRPRSATSLRMSAEQTRKLSALKAQRAARLAQASAAAQRRLVTVGITAAAVLVTVILGAMSLVSWWWAGAAGIMLVAAVVGSRVAAVNIEKAQVREEEQFKALREQVDAQGGTRFVVVGAGKNHFDQAREQVETGRSTEAAALEEPAVATDLPGSEQAAPGGHANVSSGLAPEASAEDEDKTWDVPHMPAAAPVRKSKLPRRQVHADTDLRGIPQVGQKVARPISVGGTREPAAPAARDLDLDAVLEARRAQ